MWQHQGFSIFFLNYGGLFGEEGVGMASDTVAMGKRCERGGSVLYESSLEH